ncbi:MAG TPA: MFS transporter [Streptosporangiales bacterium]
MAADDSLAAEQRTEEQTAAPTPHPRRHVILAVVSAALFMSSIDQTIVATALPALHHDLHTTINWSGWTITVYSLGRLAIVPLAGRLGDRLGRRRVFLLGTAVFTVASLLCGTASDIYVLVVLRAVQALGGGALMPSATGIVAEHFGRGRDRAVGMFTSIVPIGGLVGPVLGGIFVTYWSWRGVFLVNVPLGVVLIALGLRIIPAGRTRPSDRFDAVGAALLTGSMLAAMYAVTYLGEGHTSPVDPVFLGSTAAALLGFVLLVRRSMRHPLTAIIPARLLRGRGFGVMNVINFLYGGAALGFSALVPLYAQQRYGIRSLEAGTLLTARAVGMIVVAALAVAMLRRTGYRLPMLAGFVLSAIGLAIMAHAPVHGISAYAWLAGASALMGIGMGTASPASNNASLQLEPESATSVAGLRVMFRQAGSIIAVSVTTAILARSDHPGVAQGHVFLVFAVIVVVAVIPLVFRVPEHKGSW